MLLATHTPLDLVIIMLGSNDLKPHICGKAFGAAMGMRRLAQIVATYPFSPGEPRPRVLLVSPPVILAPCQPLTLDHFVGAESESRKLATLYQEIADAEGCIFFDAASVATVTPVDGVHLDAANTGAIGRALAPLVEGLIPAG